MQENIKEYIVNKNEEPVFVGIPRQQLNWSKSFNIKYVTKNKLKNT